MSSSQRRHHECQNEPPRTAQPEIRGGRNAALAFGPSRRRNRIRSISRLGSEALKSLPRSQVRKQKRMGIVVFSSLAEALKNGFELYDRTREGYLVRAWSSHGWAFALALCE